MYRVSFSWAVIFALWLPFTFARSPFFRKNFMAIRDSPNNQWFVQKLDHFDPTNLRSWNQRYYTSAEFYESRGNGPVFLNLGGESADNNELSGSEMSVYAKKFGALQFDLEHRYYGRSVPTENLSTSNLRFLSSEQALADTAYFIEGMNDKYNLTSENKWVVFGGSYSGNLAAWLRLKYPHLVYAAVSSSAPVLAQVDFPGYTDVVRQVLAAYSEKCAENVHRAALEVEKLLRDPHQADVATKKLNLCEKPKSKNDLSHVAESLSDPFADSVQYNPHEVSSVSDLCQEMVNGITPENLVDTYVKVYKESLMTVDSTDCIPPYSAEIDSLKNEELSPGFIRQWTYQTCTEFGYYQTSSSEKDLFGSLIDLQYYVDQCEDVFGKSFNLSRLHENVKRTNLMYGGLGVASTVSRVVFVQGSADPWHVLGINHSNNTEAPAIVIDGASHCANANNYYGMASPAIREAQNKIEQIIGEWLGIVKA